MNGGCRKQKPNTRHFGRSILNNPAGHIFLGPKRGYVGEKEDIWSPYIETEGKCTLQREENISQYSYYLEVQGSVVCLTAPKYTHTHTHTHKWTVTTCECNMLKALEWSICSCPLVIKRSRGTTVHLQMKITLTNVKMHTNAFINAIMHYWNKWYLTSDQNSWTHKIQSR